MKGEPNVAYICSRFYRAPELIFGSTDYSTMIDVWSQGCVFAELLIGTPIFPGSSGVDQLVEIIKVLGTPTKEELKSMNPNYQVNNIVLVELFDVMRNEWVGRCICFLLFLIHEYIRSRI